MSKEAPKLRLIQGGKKGPIVKLNKELFLLCAIIFIYVIVMCGV